MSGTSTRLATLSATLLIAFLLGACAAKPQRGGTRVTLLPQADGTPSAVVIRQTDAAQAGTEQRLDLPYQSASVTRGQAITVRPLEQAQVQKEYEPLFKAAPPAPTKFVLYFRTGTTQLTAESMQALTRVLAETLSRSGAEIVLIGHTDTTSSGSSNDALSLRRAVQVREMFVQRGFPSALIEATGRGERDLAVQTADGVDEPRNRRVEILVR